MSRPRLRAFRQRQLNLHRNRGLLVANPQQRLADARFRHPEPDGDLNIAQPRILEHQHPPCGHVQKHSRPLTTALQLKARDARFLEAPQNARHRHSSDAKRPGDLDLLREAATNHQHHGVVFR